MANNPFKPGSNTMPNIVMDEPSDGKAHATAMDQTWAALTSPAGGNMMRELGGAGISGYNAPLALKRPHQPKVEEMAYSRRMMQFVRRNAGVCAIAAFVYIELLGFPVERVTANEDRRVITLRRRWDHKIVDARCFVPPVEPTAIRRKGAFSLISKELPTDEIAPDAEVIRPSYAVRAVNYIASWVPHPFYSPVDSSLEGRNSLQYNRLFYYTQTYSKRKTTFLPADAVTSDGALSVHAAIKICFRTEIIRDPRWHGGHMAYGEVEAVLDMVAPQEVEKWVKGAVAYDIKMAPQARVKSDSESLAGSTEEQLRESVWSSALETKRLADVRSAVDLGTLTAAEAEEQLKPQAPLLDQHEALRRIWACNMMPRLKGRAVIEDIAWKLTLTELQRPDSNRSLDPTLSSSWTI